MGDPYAALLSPGTPTGRVRQLLEDDLRSLAETGPLADRGEREVIFRVDRDGFVRWFSTGPTRVPASELER